VTRFQKRWTDLRYWAALSCWLAQAIGNTAEFRPAPQTFLQEVVENQQKGLPPGSFQLLECDEAGMVRAFKGGQWYEFRHAHWDVRPELTAADANEFVFADSARRQLR
jgi:hypothetical protein